MWKTTRNNWKYVYRSANGSVTQTYGGYSDETAARIGVAQFIGGGTTIWRATGNNSWKSEHGDTVTVER